MNHKFYLRIVLLLILLQGITSIIGNMFYHKVLVVILEALCLIYTVRHSSAIAQTKLSKIVILYLCYILFNTFYNFVLAGRGTYDTFIALHESIWWPMCFLLAYQYFKNNQIDQANSKLTIRFFVFILCCNIVILCLQEFYLYSALERMTSNNVYYVVTLLPFAFLCKKRSLKYILMAIITLLSVVTLKRTAMIVCALTWLIDLLSVSNTKNKSKYLFAFFISLGIIVYGYQKITDVVGESALERFQGMAEDGGSGRLDIYKNVLDAYTKLPLDSKILGCGHNAVRRNNVIAYSLSGYDDSFSAHNDFLEILYDFGILGLIIYCVFIFRLIKVIYRQRYINSDLFYSGLASLGVLFTMSLFSHLVLYSTYYVYLVFIWGMFTSGGLNQKNEVAV